MNGAKAIFSQGSHFLAQPKSFQKVGLPLKGSFGLQTRNAAVWFSLGHACRSTSGSASANMLLHATDSPQLGKVGIANPKVFLQKSSTKHPTVGLFSRHQLPSALASSRSNATNSRHIRRMDKEDDWSLSADKEDFLSRKVSAKGTRTKKGLPGRQQSDFGTAERRSSPSEDRIYFLGRLLTSILRHRAVDLKLQVRDDGLCTWYTNEQSRFNTEDRIKEDGKKSCSLCIRLTKGRRRHKWYEIH